MKHKPTKKPAPTSGSAAGPLDKVATTTKRFEDLTCRLGEMNALLREVRARLFGDSEPDPPPPGDWPTPSIDTSLAHAHELVSTLQTQFQSILERL